MNWSGPETTPATLRIAAVLPMLNASERRVANLLAGAPDRAVDETADELAHRAGVARSTVIRTSQSLGYPGYPQLRVALARELSTGASARSGEAEGPATTALLATADGIAALAPAIDEDALADVARIIAEARRVLAVGVGFSAPIAAEAALRLSYLGRPAEHVADGMAQRISASGLREDDVCLVVSASGTDPAALAAARSARTAGARVVLVTSVPGSRLTYLADVSLVVPPIPGPMRSQQEQTSRIPHTVLLEVLVDAVAERLIDADSDTGS